MEEYRKKDEENQELNSKLQEDLKSLYHGKYHKEFEPNPVEAAKEDH